MRVLQQTFCFAIILICSNYRISYLLVSSSYVLDVPYSLFIGTDGYLLHILRGIERERVL
jgi:hypothetical protein